MAHINKVLKSINADGDLICVDLFQRPDGSFGFEEYRRDPEDGRGWYPVAFHSAARFDSAEAAEDEAKAKIVWLADALSG